MRFFSKSCTALAVMINGGINIILGGVYMGYGIAAYILTSNVRFGAWWAGMMVIITGIVGTVSCGNK